MKPVALVLLLGLAACTTAQSRIDQVAADDSSCRGYGFTAGTDAYAQCRLQMDQQRAQQSFARRQAVAAGLQNLARATAPPPRTTLNCTSSTMGIYTNTNCY